MATFPLALALLMSPQEPTKQEPAADRARRAAAVDRIMDELPGPSLRRTLEGERIAQPASPNAPERRLLVAPPVVAERIAQQARPNPSRRQLRIEPKPEEPAVEIHGPDGRILPGLIRFHAQDDKPLASENFDLWLFDDEADEATRRARLDALLDRRIAQVAKPRRLDPARMDKLRLAGAGDIKRLLGEVEGRRAQFEAVRLEYSAGLADLKQLESLAQRFRIGPFDDQSLFAKTLRRIDEDDRAARFGTN